MSFDALLPVIFLALLGLALFVYVCLDGYDLGVGMLLPLAREASDKDAMIASIGPFWDANETWLVLGVGLLLTAFPRAQGIVFGALYLPVAVMLAGLILRGVAFDFRVKAHDDHRRTWNALFAGGSTIASLAQGWMLGRFVLGLEDSLTADLFAALIALALPAAYVLLGASWLLLKTEGAVQARARIWALRAWAPMVAGFALISIATPLASATVRERWFTLPEFIALLPIPLFSAACLGLLRALLGTRRVEGRLCWAPYALTIAVLILGFIGLAYSLFPYIVMDRLTIWQAASRPATLKVLLLGVAVAVPAIAFYTVLAYRVFRGKAGALLYA